MDVRALEALVAVVDEGSFTAAGSVLRVSQPAVSSQIARLERELDGRLLIRGRHGVEPTPLGREVVLEARAMLRAVRAIEQLSYDTTHVLRGHISLGTVASPGELDLAATLGVFHRHYPGVNLSVTENTSDELQAQVRSGHLDLAVLSTPAWQTIDLPHEVLSNQHLTVVSAPGTLPERATVEAEELIGHDIITLPKGTATRAVLMNLTPRPQVALELSDLRLATALAGQRLGVAIMPNSTLNRIEHQPLQRTTLDSPPVTLSLVWTPAGPSRATSRLIDLIRQRRNDAQAS